ncbi:MAG: thioredoxin domain-containing protein [Chromatiales bacterium]|nr:thioredoxin domain-containing protein [Chromatiales bacterium]
MRHTGLDPLFAPAALLPLASRRRAARQPAAAQPPLRHISPCTPPTRWPGRSGARRRWRGRGPRASVLYLSIGYFSCHWCHVMQRESYQ